jgi:hypothetical protein
LNKARDQKWSATRRAEDGLTHTGVILFQSTSKSPRSYRANPAESRLASFGVRAGSHEPAIFLSRAFRDNDDGKFFTELLAFSYFRADALAENLPRFAAPRIVPPRGNNPVSIW